MDGCQPGSAPPPAQSVHSDTNMSRVYTLQHGKLPSAEDNQAGISDEGTKHEHHSHHGAARRTFGGIYGGRHGTSGMAVARLPRLIRWRRGA